MGRLDPNTTEAQITYSPDNRFKILVTLGESCGAYCNPYNMCWFYIAKKNGATIEKPFDFIDPITEIKILTKTSARAGTDGKTYTDYLILTQNWCRPRGFEAGSNWNFHHLRIQGDSLQFIQPIFGNDENNSSEIYSADVLCIQQENPGMWYNEKTKIITFLNYVYNDGDEKCYEYKGKYTFLNGRFLQTPTKRF